MGLPYNHGNWWRSLWKAVVSGSGLKANLKSLSSAELEVGGKKAGRETEA